MEKLLKEEIKIIFPRIKVSKEDEVWSVENFAKQTPKFCWDLSEVRSLEPFSQVAKKLYLPSFYPKGTRRYSQGFPRKASRSHPTSSQDETQLNFHRVPREVLNLWRLLCKDDRCDGHVEGCLQAKRCCGTVGGCKLIDYFCWLIKTLKSFSNAKRIIHVDEFNCVIFCQCPCNVS